MEMMSDKEFAAYLQRERPDNPVATVRHPLFLMGVSDARKGLGWPAGYDDWLYVDQSHYEIGRHFAVLFPKEVDIKANANMAVYALMDYLQKGWISV
jgi:hypothetical protein